MVAFIWGTAFVAQTTGMKSMGPVTFTGFRLLLGGLVLLPFTYFYFNNKSLNFEKIRICFKFGLNACVAVVRRHLYESLKRKSD